MKVLIAGVNSAGQNKSSQRFLKVLIKINILHSTVHTSICCTHTVCSGRKARDRKKIKYCNYNCLAKLHRFPFFQFSMGVRPPGELFPRGFSGAEAGRDVSRLQRGAGFTIRNWSVA